MLSYDEYLIESARLNKIADDASAELQLFPRGEFGLTPDYVRESVEFREAKARFSVAMTNCQRFNRTYVKVYGKRRAAERRASRKWGGRG